MNSHSITKLTLVAVVLVVGILFLNVTDENGTSTAGDLLLPELRERANDINRVSIGGSDEAAITIVSKDGQWVVAERNDFPANAATLRDLLLSLVDARAIEQKTADPSRYAQLGVDEGLDASGRTISIAGNGFEYAIIIGNEAHSSYRYARVVGDPQSWLINANPDIPDSAGDWLDDAVIDIAATDVRAVTIRHSDGEELRIFKESEEESDFQVDNIPEGRELSYATVANGIGGVLDGLTLDDVKSSSAFSGEATASTRFELFAGDEVVADSYEVDGEYWIAISRHAAGDAAGDKQAAWLYRLPDYKRNLLNRRWEDILKSEE